MRWRDEGVTGSCSAATSCAGIERQDRACDLSVSRPLLRIAARLRVGLGCQDIRPWRQDVRLYHGRKAVGEHRDTANKSKYNTDAIERVEILRRPSASDED
jgi:hypothetical protein